MTAVEPQSLQDETPIQEGKPAPQKVGRERSSIEFSYLGLDVALEVAKAVHETGGSRATTDLVAAHMEESANGGGFRNKVVTARIFGLATYSNGTITLTPLGSRSVDPDQAKAARAEAFLHVPLYRKLYEDFKGLTLPPTSLGLEAVIVNLGVAAKQKDKARQAFQRSANLAGFFAYGPTKLVYPVVNGSSEPKGVITPPASPLGGHEGTPSKPPGGSGGDGGDGGDGGGNQSLIDGLLKVLPKAGSLWSLESRKKWLQTAAANFDYAYNTASEESRAIKVTIEND